MDSLTIYLLDPMNVDFKGEYDEMIDNAKKNPDSLDAQVWKDLNTCTPLKAIIQNVKDTKATASASVEKLLEWTSCLSDMEMVKEQWEWVNEKCLL